LTIDPIQRNLMDLKKVEDLKVEIQGMQVLWEAMFVSIDRDYFDEDLLGDTPENISDNIDSLMVNTEELIKKLESRGGPSEP